jgi:hypothetical protein
MSIAQSISANEQIQEMSNYIARYISTIILVQFVALLLLTGR